MGRSVNFRDRRGLVVSSRLRSRRTPGSKHDSTEDRSAEFVGLCALISIMEDKTSSRWCGAEIWTG
ncbi:hypothetical protein AVEN_176787-1, partial [Araneus ventricosus]